MMSCEWFKIFQTHVWTYSEYYIAKWTRKVCETSLQKCFKKQCWMGSISETQFSTLKLSNRHIIFLTSIVHCSDDKRTTGRKQLDLMYSHIRCTHKISYHYAKMCLFLKIFGRIHIYTLFGLQFTRDVKHCFFFFRILWSAT